MADVTKTITVGIEDLKISKLEKDDETGVKYGDLLDVAGVKEIDVTFTLDEKELTGDGVTLDTFSKTTGYEVSFKNAQLTPEIMCLINGSTLTTATEGEQEVTVIEDAAADQPNYFALQFKPVRTVGSGDYHRELYKVSGKYQEEYAEDDYMVCSFSGKGVARTFDKKFGAKKFYKTGKADIAEIAELTPEAPTTKASSAAKTTTNTNTDK